MSSVARHFRFIHISITFLSVIVLFHSLFLLVPNYIDSVEAEDIELGTSALTEGTDIRTQGKRSLTKPSGGANTTGVKV